jgi:SSS family solute:Na+ symporter
VKILRLTLGLDKTEAMVVTLVIAAFIVLYTSSSGLWSVLWTDVIQFVLKMGVVIALAVFAIHAIGGMDGLRAKLETQDAHGAATLAFTPSPAADWFVMFLVFLSINWWASWYPGSEPGGGGYVAQRIFSAKNEKHSLAATLWFNIAHYALRPWPWILTALVAVVLYPHQKDPEVGYIQVMIDHLPAYLRGLMLAGFAAAYMSTMATHINLGASYLLNDFYRRFVKKDGDEKHYVAASRIATVLVTLIAAVASFYMESIEGAWKFLIAIGAGAGLVFMLRWFWWRINAWSEIAAMVAAATSSLFLQSRPGAFVVSFLQRFDPLLPAGPLDASHPHGFAWLMIITTEFTTVSWVVVTLLTPPEPMEKLQSFYKLVQPASAGWRPIADSVGIRSKQSLLWAAADWIAGCGLIYFSLFGVGRLIFGPITLGIVYLLAAAVCGSFIYWDLNRRGWDTLRD